MSDKYGYYFPDPGTVEAASCGLCGADMDVTRNVDGSTGLMMVWAGRTRRHDCFRCPHYSQPWHRQLYDLERELGRTRSPRLQAAIRLDIADIQAEHIAVRD
jgi:hypothetical protein